MAANEFADQEALIIRFGVCKEQRVLGCRFEYRLDSPQNGLQREISGALYLQRIAQISSDTAILAGMVSKMVSPEVPEIAKNIEKSETGPAYTMRNLTFWKPRLFEGRVKFIIL